MTPRSWDWPVRACLLLDRGIVVTVGDDRRVRNWQTATAAIVSEMDWKIGPRTAVAFSPDGLTCAAGVKNGQVVVWDVDA